MAPIGRARCSDVSSRRVPTVEHNNVGLITRNRFRYCLTIIRGFVLPALLNCPGMYYIVTKMRAKNSRPTFLATVWTVLESVMV